MIDLQRESTAAIHSALAADADFSELVNMFVAELPQRLASMRKCLATRDWHTLGRLTHQLKSAVGSYGFDPLTPWVERLELAVRNDFSADLVEDSLAALTQMCDRAQAGAPPPIVSLPLSAGSEMLRLP